MAPPVHAESIQVHLESDTHEEAMIAYIRRHFAELLGPDTALLGAPGGLDALASKFHGRARLFDATA